MYLNKKYLIQTGILNISIRTRFLVFLPHFRQFYGILIWEAEVGLLSGVNEKILIRSIVENQKNEYLPMS